MQLSTVISDAVLAGVSFYCAWGVYLAGSRYGAIGLGLVGLASLAGVFRFSVLPQIAPLHSMLSGMAGQVGIPLLALSFLSAVFQIPSTDSKILVLGGLLLIAFLFNRLVFSIPAYGIVIGGLAALAIVIAGVRALPGTAGLLAIAGAIILIVAGLAIGSSGTMAGFKRVDLYHYVLAVSMYMMGTALRQLT
ncbi:MAG: hypothetical protein K8S54_05760 [Spirochaetia bacterium]|nr:hypothetical protein [Spirochaetia bacterium]